MGNRFGILLVLLLSATLAFSVSFSYLYKGVSFKCKGNNDGTAVITGFNRTASDVCVPATVMYGGVAYSVKEVSTFVNGDNYSARSLQLEEGIERIGKSSFIEFRWLKEVILPSTIRQIGRNAFRNNSSLHYTLPSSVDEADLRQGKEITVSAWSRPSMTVANKPANGEAARLQAKAEAERLKQERERLAEEQRRLEKEKAEIEKQKKEAEKAKKQAEAANNKISKKGNSVFSRLNRGKNNAQKADNSDNTTVSASSVHPQRETVATTPQPTVPFVSDIERDIPERKEKNEHTYCLIIANEDYKGNPDVEFAIHDGEVFHDYAMKALGIPKDQIKVFKNASYTDMVGGIDWLKGCQRFDPNARLILYYAGHGVPRGDGSAYLLPTDGNTNYLEKTCISLKELYSDLETVKVESVIVLLDACFSGMQRGNSQLAINPSRGAALRTKREMINKGNVIVFSAADSSETAGSNSEQRHGLFTYHLLKKIQSKKGGKVQFGELFEYVYNTVGKSAHMKDQRQTPTHSESPNMKNRWRNLYF